ncbi:RagB/SusD family nutrient uptake outer membrane protein [Sphingobacterium hungaricum]|uniref:RagB/SusD family nutrient uptake outer membrane protein n=1 Tax=Sphingobacterium hungaricum TaxID=2082723 RepID=A0A928YQ11_9SPHI|nr:RagB/SusD family nutrient uptake outer membrane protein [Sphingobacterium hungaricum]MBE8713726.1 RagB/SusD family nutrient uptake outer membrane protein [Sphingobacterium hungaricum]
MKLLYKPYFLLLLIAFISCNKTLDSAPDGKISMDEIFEDPVKVGAFLNSCYNNIPGKGARYFFWMRGPVVWSDEAWDADAEAEPTLTTGRIYNGNVSALNHPAEVPGSVEAGNGQYWARYWNAIRNCTVFISRIDNAVVTSEEERRRWKAEAHLLRAYYYHELLKWYGAVLPITREPYSFEQDFSEVVKASYYEVAKFIEEDCNVALATSELPWRITTGESYRVTKALAEAIKSKMLLFAASPLFNSGENYWEEAYQANKTAVENLKRNGYALYNKINYPQTYQSTTSFFGPNNDAYAALYNEYFTQGMSFGISQIDMETIFQSREGQGNIWNIDGIGAQDGYKSGTNPTQEMVDAYETSDGQPVLNLKQPYLDEKHLQPNYNSNNTLYNPLDPYANRDPRFYASIYYNGSKRKALWNFIESPDSPENYPGGIGNRTRIISTYVGEPQTGISATARKATRTGYYHRKFLHPNSGNDNPIAGANYKLFRLGEIILNYAEAAAEAGHFTDAENAVNEIRARVNMPPIPSGLSKEDLLLRIKNERRVELAFEENRYFDVRRWSNPTDDLSETDAWVTAAEITRNPNGSYTYRRRTVRALSRSNFSNRSLLMPIPLLEADRLRSITGLNWQNPGW